MDGEDRRPQPNSRNIIRSDKSQNFNTKLHPFLLWNGKIIISFPLQSSLQSFLMQTLLNPSHFFTFPNLPTSRNSNSPHSSFQWRPLLCPPLTLPGNFSVKCFSSDEFPVDESFLEKFGPKDEETEDQARKRNWVERGWAPWEEVFTPEADFARKSLNEGEEVPLQTPEAIEAFKMLSPKYRKQKMEEMGLTEDDYYRTQCEIKGEIPEPLETTWTRPLVLQVVPPRDWPPRGWDVDREELEFIRGAHKLQAVRVDLDRLEKDVRTDTEDLCLDRYKVFLKQYKEWVAANKDRLEEESYKVCHHPPSFLGGELLSDVEKLNML